MDIAFLIGVFYSPDLSSTTFSYVFKELNPSTKYYYRLRAKNASGYSVYSGITTVNTVVTALHDQNIGNSNYSFFPNPVSEAMNFEYNLLENTQVQLDIYSVNGQKMKSLLNERNQIAGKYVKQFDISELTNGIYLVRFITGGYTKTFKIIIEK